MLTTSSSSMQFENPMAIFKMVVIGIPMHWNAFHSN